jgi:membrane protease YdiL (CAAX protease family)
MELDSGITPAPPPSASKAHFIFSNERGLRAGWRLLIFIAIAGPIGFVMLGFFGVMVRSSGADFRSPLIRGLLNVVMFLAVVVASFLMGVIEKRRPGTYGLPLQRSAASSFVMGYFLWGFLPLTVVLAIMRALGVFYFGKPGLNAAEAIQWGLLWGFVFLTVGLSEDYLFRGYALYTLADGIGFWPATVILALLFGFAHMGNGGESYIGIMGTILFAFFASATLRRTGNLWLAVGAHSGWDWGQSFFFGVPDSGLQTPGHLFNPPPPQGPAWLSGGTVGPEGSIVVLIVWALMTAVFLLFWPHAAGQETEKAPSPHPFPQRWSDQSS